MIAVSIIIPMYNVAHFLDTCLGSVLEQHMEKHTFEVLMIDDGSPDNSRSKADELAKKYSFIKVFSQKNKGLGGARNTGIRNANGKYLIFLDSDDVLLPDALLKLIAKADKNTLEILEFGATQTDASGNLLATIAMSTNGRIYNGINYYKKMKYMNSACNKLYNLNFIKKNQLVFTEKIYREDFEFNTRAFFSADRVMATSILAASFLQSPNSITRNKSREKKDKYIRDFRQILKLIEIFKKEHLSNESSTDQINYFEERIAVSNLVLFYFMFKNNYSYSEMKNVRQDLKSEGLYRENFEVTDRRMEIFRKIMLKNFLVFQFIQPLKRLLSI